MHRLLLLLLGCSALAVARGATVINSFALIPAGIVIDASADYESSGTGTTWNLNITTTQTLTNACFILAGHYYRAAGAVTSVTCSVDGTGGLTATVANDGLDDYVVGGNAGFFLTRVLFTSKAAGTYAASITFSASITDLAWGVLALGNVDQTTPLSTLTGGTGGPSTTPSATITSAAGELVFMVVGHDNNMTAAGSGDTIQWGADAAGGYMYCEGLTSPGASSVTVSGTIGSAQWGYIICRINPSP